MKLILATLALAFLPATAPDDVYKEDMAFALDQLEEQCGHFFKLKEIEWKKVRKEMTKEVKRVKDDAAYHALMWRLLARLEDGHAAVKPGKNGEQLPWPEELQAQKYSPGVAFCKVGKKLYVRDVRSAAEEVGLAPGMEVLKVDDLAAAKWVDAHVAELRDAWSYSTDQHALFHALCLGMAKEQGARLKIEYKDLGGKKKKRTITVGKSKNFHFGVPFPDESMKKSGETLFYGKTKRGYGYMHIRWVKGTLLEDVDRALAELGDVPGLILDFRGNSGGGIDHDALEARFIPTGKELPRMARSPLASQGPNPYGGKMVVIVNGTVVSAGETTSGMFKEDGRAYMIGESATAGMSSQKTTIELPSGKCSLYVSIGSNRSSFNGGRGIEGIGVPPDEIVEFDPDELKEKVDTLIRRAEDILDDFPQKKVRYDPADYE